MKDIIIRRSKQGLGLALALWNLGLANPGLLRAQNDEPAATPAANDAAAAATTETMESPAETTAVVTEEESNPGRHRHRPSRDVVFALGHDVEVKPGETVDTVVVIGGSARIRGHVNDTAVAIFGNLEIDGEIGDTAVTVMGNLKAGQEAKIHGAVVTVGGRADIDPGATLDEHPQVVDFPNWVKQWFRHCVLMARPLAPQVGWVWGVAGVFFLMYLLTAALFPRPVQACVTELTDRPATTFLLGILAHLLVPLILLILAATGLGLVVVPFLLAALFFGALIGKVAIVEGLGIKVGRLFGTELIQKPVIALVLGAVLVALLYLVPVLGLLAFGVISLWGLGAAVTAAFGGLRREMPEKVAPVPPTAPTPTMSNTMAMPVDTATPDSTPSGTTAAAPSMATPVLPPVIVPEALDLPKAGFWERMAAAFLDLILVSILGAIVGGPPFGLVVALAYFAGMWVWKGTTIGGIVLGLKVVRLDGQPVTFAVALVRALAGAFSLVVLFLGILWIAWDKEKQGWHDKIAGTTVLKLPRGTPLVCY
jgi:uncharacterized RDD family membrane protein YckC